MISALLWCLTWLRTVDSRPMNLSAEESTKFMDPPFWVSAIVAVRNDQHATLYCTHSVTVFLSGESSIYYSLATRSQCRIYNQR